MENSERLLEKLKIDCGEGMNVKLMLGRGEGKRIVTGMVKNDRLLFFSFVTEIGFSPLASLIIGGVDMTEGSMDSLE